MRLSSPTRAASTVSAHCKVKRVFVPDAKFRDGLVAHGVAEHRAKLLLGIFKAARRGDFAAMNPALQQLIGRRPRTMRDVLATKLQV